MLKRTVILAAGLLLVIYGQCQAQQRASNFEFLIGKQFRLETYNGVKYTEPTPITLSFNEIGNPNFLICGRNIVSPTPDHGVAYPANSTFATAVRPTCPDHQSREIVDIYYAIMTNGGSGATDRGELFYILTDGKQRLSFTRIKE